MDWMVFGAIGVILLVIVLWPGRALAEERTRAMSLLRGPTLNLHTEEDFSEEVFADFKQMVLGVARHYQERPAWRRTTVHELKRTPGPAWQMKETAASWSRSLAIARREQLKDPARWSARAEELARDSSWEPVPAVWAATLEPAYQRFTQGYQATLRERSRVEEELLKDFDERAAEAPPA